MKTNRQADVTKVDAAGAAGGVSPDVVEVAI
jgi:hypothetical protein